MQRLLFNKEIALECAKNVAMGFAPLRAWRVNRPRTTVSSADPASDMVERYALALPRKLLAAVGEVEGKYVAEIGPGDHLATGLAMLALGARSYACLDRFSGPYSNEYAKGFYRSLRAAWPKAFQGRPWPEWLDPARFPEAYPDRVKVLTVGVEDTKGTPDFDIVCSHAVGEHVLDVDAFARTSFDFLRPGGVAMHVVDFSQHYNWSSYGDEFLFLSLSDRVWHLMGSNRGLPNRVRFHEFLAALEATGLTVETKARRLSAEAPDLAALLPRFRMMPLDSLRTLDATFVCTKP